MQEEKEGRQRGVAARNQTTPGTRYRLLSGTSAYPNASFSWQLPSAEAPLVVAEEEENSSGRPPDAQR